MSDSQPSRDSQPLDEDLVHLFEDARASLPAKAFLEPLERRMARARTLRRILRLGLLAVLVVSVAVLAPYASRGSLAAIDYAARWVPQIGLAMNSPAGWIGSLLLGLWVLRRSHAFER